MRYLKTNHQVGEERLRGSKFAGMVLWLILGLAAFAEDDKSLDTARDRLVRAEDRALFYKFDSFLQEEDPGVKGEIRLGPDEGNEADKASAGEVQREVMRAVTGPFLIGSFQLP